jgi:hypothetical protein
MTKRKTTDEFIINAIKVHGDRYDYSLSDYINCKLELKIICKKHGIFDQDPSNHLSGKGCNKCGIEERSNKQRMSIEDFIEKSTKIHNSKYIYNNVIYIDTSKKVNIICKEHGNFPQSPNNHLHGFGCPKCGAIEIATKLSAKARLEFINKAIIIHKGKYTYENVEYITARKFVNITCPLHGNFSQIPDSHLRGCGCDKCGIIERAIKLSAKAKADFKDKASIVHKGKYTYENVVYINAITNVNITCSIHGIFPQSPDPHLRGAGCPLCAKTGFDINKPSYHYYIRFDNPNINSLYKVGVTNNTPKKRLMGMQVSSDWTPTILQELYFENGQDALDLERYNKQTFKEFQYTGESIMQNGNTELFIKDILS